MKLSRKGICASGLALVVLAPTSLLAGTVSYDYDALNRLIGVTYPNGTEIQYSYDPAGNMTHKTVIATGDGEDDQADVDGNGVADALTDGILIIRRLFGFTGAALIDGAVGEGCTRCDATAIAGYIDQIQDGLDVDGNGLTDALTDGLLIIRYLFGFQGSALTDGAVGVGCTRCTAEEISEYCATLVP